MVQHKAQLKKQQKRGVDFKKIKRKIGRKLPPPKNATNTEVKSKAIILPEQSVASDKAGLAVSKKGLTLKELLQQTSHHNAKVRRDALIGIRDIFLKHPEELKLHRLSVIEKPRERISDDDKMVRETLYQLLKAVIFPACKEDNQGPSVSLMMAYVFNAMTHLAIDVRLTAFKFLDLIVQHYPSSFSLYAEKILQHYKEMLQKNQFNFHDKRKLKSILAGLAYCLSLLPCSRRNKNSSMGNVVADRKILHSFESVVSEVHSGFSATKELKDLLPILISALQDLIPSVHTTVPLLEAQSFDCALSILRSVDFIVKFFVYGSEIRGEQLKVFPPDRGDQAVLQLLLKKLFDVFPLKPTHLSEKDESRYFVLNVIVSEMFFCLCGWNTPPSALLEKYLEFLGIALSEKVSISVHSGKAFFHKHAISLIPFIPKLIMQVEGTWKSHILQAFTEVFKKCDPESSMKLACLSAINEMLFPKHGWRSLNTSDSEYLDFQITWIRELPSLLILLGDKNPVSSKAVLGLQLRVGQCAFMNPSLLQEFDNMQYSLREFFSTCLDGGGSLYGPFMRLARDIQEISVSCLYYLSFMDPLLLQSLVTCCLCQEMEPFLLFRILEVLDSAYRAGHIRIADYISFLITLLSRYEVIPGSSSLTMKKCGKSNSGTFKSVTGAICSFLSQIGDGCLVFQMLEKAVIGQISNKPPTENVCALLRVLITLDSRPTKISEESISELGNALPGYLIDIVSRLSEEDHESSNNVRTRKSHYYLLPCFLLFYGSNKLINRVLNVMRYFISEDASPAFLRQGHHCTADHSSRISSVVYVLVLLHEDVRLRQILLSCEEEIDSILQDILGIMSREGNNLSIEEKHKIQCAYDRLKTFIGG